MINFKIYFGYLKFLIYLCTMIKFICRIIALPFVFGLILVTYNVHVVKYSILFLLYGGEWITYKKGERKTIQDIFKKLNENI